ncbi:MAG: YdeI/OmpD-associated family protein, partial [Candidatus Dormibacteraceae bacterium]
SPTQRREYARWVADAKRVDTVQHRIAATLERLRSAG